MANKVRALVTIVDYHIGDVVIDYYKEKKTTFAITTHGYGTAKSRISNIMGLEENKKSITITVLEKYNAQSALNAISKKLSLNKAGNGIAFTIPVTSMNQFFVKMMEKYNDIWLDSKEKAKQMKEKERIKEKIMKEGGEEMNNDFPYELIFTIVERDYLEYAKKAALKAGARGGTSIHALGLGNVEASSFLGITINPEKEIMLNVVKKEDKNKVMTAIVSEVGIATAGQGICFSLPVDSAFGLAGNTKDEQLKEDYDNN